MDDSKKLKLGLLSTGVAGLDEVLGGGLPEYSFNLVAGPPGAGKTTLMHQLMFANASTERPALYFTVLGEPAIKMLRYQQQMAFFDPEKIGTVLRFVDLSAEVLSGELGAVLKKILDTVNETNPAIVCIDSFRTVTRLKPTAGADEELAGFLQRLALHLTSAQTTSFVIAEYAENDNQDNPLFTIADGIFMLSQNRDRNAIVRKLEVMKLRGQLSIPGRHTFRITGAGLQVFPRTIPRFSANERKITDERALTGVPGLDELLGGGIPVGDATLIAGPSGTGKTMFGTQFVNEGVRRGETAVLAIFEEVPADYIARAERAGFEIGKMVDEGKLALISIRPIDLSPEEVIHEIQLEAARLGAKRVVIDSLNGLEVALAPNHRDDFRDSLYRMVTALTGGGVSVLMTVEVVESFHQVSFSPHAVSFLAQNIFFLRYVELNGDLRKVLAIIKMRRSSHSRALHSYEIRAGGVRVQGAVRGYRGVLSGVMAERVVDASSATAGIGILEQVLLTELTRRQTASLETLAAGNGRHELVAEALERLESLGYVTRRQVEDEMVYVPGPVTPPSR